MAWNPTYATALELSEWITDASPDDSAQLDLAIEAASRSIDRTCGRQFGVNASPEVRYYTAEYDRHLCQWFVDIDDVQTTVGVVVQLDNDRDGTPETTVTAYRLGPVNANGRPWTRIEILPGAPVKPNGIRHGVAVTAIWGWTTVPDAIKLATMIQASRLYARRESQSGPLSSLKVDDVAYAWAATDLDADVAATVAPYRKVWGAA